MKENKIILIVDDEIDIVETLSIFLSMKGFGILKAYNGLEALELIKSNGAIDLVISDVKMPKMDGKMLLEEIRKTNPDIPAILLVTGHFELDEESAKERGAQGLLTKPFHYDELYESILKILHK